MMNKQRQGLLRLYARQTRVLLRRANRLGERLEALIEASADAPAVQRDLHLTITQVMYAKGSLVDAADDLDEVANANSRRGNRNPGPRPKAARCGCHLLGGAHRRRCASYTPRPARAPEPAGRPAHAHRAAAPPDQSLETGH